MDSRGVSPVVEKLLAAGIVLLFVSGMTTALFGDVVPQYRTASGQEVAERVVSRAANAIERSLPTVSGAVTVRRTFEVPGTIRSSGYSLALRPDGLVVRHPDPAIGARTALELPPSVAVDRGSVDSGATLVVTVSGPAGNRTVSLAEVDG
jgi:hypothetical protein